MSENKLEQLLSQQPSEKAFADILELLDQWKHSDISSLIEYVEIALQDWPDVIRKAPQEAWQAVQVGESLPPWWSLIRHIRVEDEDTLDVSSALNSITSIDLSRVYVDPSPLRNAHNIRQINLSASQDLIDLEFLLEIPYLEHLILSNLEDLPDISLIGQLSTLRGLDLSFNPNLEDLSSIERLSELRWLDLSGNDRITNLGSLAMLSGLKTLILNGCKNLQNIEFLQELKTLKILFAFGLEAVSDLSPLISLKIEALHIGGCKIKNGKPIGEVSTLHELMLTGLPNLEDLTFIQKLDQLKALGIVACRVPLPQLNLSNLENLIVEDCPNVHSLTSLVNLKPLSSLSLCVLPVSDLIPLAHLSQLKILSLAYCKLITDLSPLVELPLQMLDLVGCNPELDTRLLPSGCQIIR